MFKKRHDAEDSNSLTLVKSKGILTLSQGHYTGAASDEDRGIPSLAAVIRMSQSVFLRFTLLKPVFKEDDYGIVGCCGVD